MLHKKMMLALLLWLVCSANTLAADVQETPDGQKNMGSQKQAVPIDRIAVVVNDDVITVYELNARLSTVEQQLNKQGTPLPATDVLKKQILERMITDMLQSQ